MSRRPWLLSISLAMLLAASACGGSGTANEASTGTSDTTNAAREQAESSATQGAASPPAPSAELGESERIIGRTNATAEGNRFVDVQLDLGRAPTEVAIGFVPAWIAAVDSSEGQPIEWVAVADTGEAVAIDGDGNPTPIERSSTGQQPVVLMDGDGSLRITPLNSLTPSDLPNATLVEGRNGVRAWLDGPTDRYQHGALDDVIEASELVIERRTVIDPMDEPGEQRVGDERVVVTLTDTVAEGLAPLLADLDGDGVDEVLITEANAEVGARLVVYRLDGSVLARSEPIGRGNRWRHQLAVAPTGPNGEIEISEVQTPHLSGTAQFLRLDGDRLVLQASLDGFGSHPLGSANLDMAVVADADLDADGPGSEARYELVVPIKDRSALAVLARLPADGGATIEILQTIPLPSTLRTNLAVAPVDDAPASSGRMAVGVAEGIDAGLVLIWD